MICDEIPYPYADWLDFLAHPQAYPERLDEIGRVGQYIFYRVVHAQ